MSGARSASVQAEAIGSVAAPGRSTRRAGVIISRALDGDAFVIHVMTDFLRRHAKSADSGVANGAPSDGIPSRHT